MRTVGEVVECALPEGSLFQSRDDLTRIAPSWPPDLFGVSGLLLTLSGAYHHIWPQHAPGQIKLPKRHFVIDDEINKRASDIGRDWRDGVGAFANADPLSRAPATVDKLWTALLTHWSDPIFARLSADEQPPGWWEIVAELLLIADEAAAGFGFRPKIPEEKQRLPDDWLAVTAYVTFVLIPLEIRKGARNKKNTYQPVFIEDLLSNWSAIATTMGAITPKSRRPNVGCTLRSLSKNLALLPPSGEARANWLPLEDPPGAEGGTLNLLLVPFPYHIPAKCFEPMEPEGCDHPEWGWFHLSQSWLSDTKAFSRFFKALLSEVEKEAATPIDGIIFPELALDRAHFEIVAEISKKRGIPLLISGISQSLEGKRDGNFVRTQVFSREKQELFQYTQEKHHRWKLEGGQIIRYGLGDVLDPDKEWWEAFAITSRSVNIFPLTARSTAATLICEDLARADPCQTLLRSVGPDLVIALLMDGPQLTTRWSSRYATVLAEDPGSSVLTFTSLGLINRDVSQRGDRCVALWREASGSTQEIRLPIGADAILLTLSEKDQGHRTLDGRTGQLAFWKYRGATSITVRGKNRRSVTLGGNYEDEE